MESKAEQLYHKVQMIYVLRQLEGGQRVARAYRLMLE